MSFIDILLSNTTSPRTNETQASLNQTQLKANDTKPSINNTTVNGATHDNSTQQNGTNNTQQNNTEHKQNATRPFVNITHQAITFTNFTTNSTANSTISTINIIATINTTSLSNATKIALNDTLMNDFAIVVNNVLNLSLANFTATHFLEGSAALNNSNTNFSASNSTFNSTAIAEEEAGIFKSILKFLHILPQTSNQVDVEFLRENIPEAEL
jgi:hypothetical protein